MGTTMTIKIINDGSETEQLNKWDRKSSVTEQRYGTKSTTQSGKVTWTSASWNGTKTNETQWNITDETVSASTGNTSKNGTTSEITGYTVKKKQL